MDVDSRPPGRLLCERKPAEVVLELPVRVDARLDAQLAGAVLDRLVHAPDELLAVVLVGVRRALSLPEPTERASDDVHVRDVYVAVHHERDGLAGKLLAQLIGRLAKLLDHLRPRL